MADDVPGSVETLEELYRVVPAAEEHDLVESSTPLQPDPEPGDGADEEPAPSTGQALGMLEHLLDAEMIEPEDPEDPEQPEDSA